MLRRWRILRSTRRLRLWFETIWKQHANLAIPANYEVRGFSFGACDGLASTGQTIEFNRPDHTCRHAPLRLTRWLHNGSLSCYEIDLCLDRSSVLQIRIHPNGPAVRRYVYSGRRSPNATILTPTKVRTILADLNRTYHGCHAVRRSNLRLVRAP